MGVNLVHYIVNREWFLFLCCITGWRFTKQTDWIIRNVDSSFFDVLCHRCVDVPVFHSSTLERRIPVQSHPQQQGPLPVPPTHQEVDNDMVEILIWPHGLKKHHSMNDWMAAPSEKHSNRHVNHPGSSSKPAPLSVFVIHTKRHFHTVMFTCEFIQTLPAWLMFLHISFIPSLNHCLSSSYKNPEIRRKKQEVPHQLSALAVFLNAYVNMKWWLELDWYLKLNGS